MGPAARCGLPVPNGFLIRACGTLAAAACCTLCQLLHHQLQAEAASLLARREFLESSEELADDMLRRHTDARFLCSPVPFLAFVVRLPIRSRVRRKLIFALPLRWVCFSKAGYSTRSGSGTVRTDSLRFGQSCRLSTRWWARAR